MSAQPYRIKRYRNGVFVERPARALSGLVGSSQEGFFFATEDAFTKWLVDDINLQAATVVGVGAGGGAGIIGGSPIKNWGHPGSPQEIG